jgi:hypothetical protein
MQLVTLCHGYETCPLDLQEVGNCSDLLDRAVSSVPKIHAAPQCNSHLHSIFDIDDHNFIRTQVINSSVYC